MELNEADVSDRERAIGTIVMLFGRDAPINEYMLKKAVKYLQRGEETVTQSSRKQDIDILKDFPYIATSIQTQYHLNIRDDDIHFWHFIDLIEGLGDTLINRIRDVRNMDLKDIKDFKQKKAVIEAKNYYSLNKSKIEKPLSLAELYAQIEKEKGGVENG